MGRLKLPIRRVSVEAQQDAYDLMWSELKVLIHKYLKASTLAPKSGIEEGVTSILVALRMELRAMNRGDLAKLIEPTIVTK